MTPKSPSLFDWNIAGPAIAESFKKLDPRLMIRNPVMFVTMVGAVLTTAGILTSPTERGFITQLAVWLWLTVLFANLAEAVAEGRGKAQADSLRRARKDTIARRLRNGREEKIAAPALQKGDLVVCEAGELIPADGEVIEGIASVDESAITGESAPVIRESGGDRSAVTGGTRVISDRIVVRITMEKGHGFLDRMIAMVEGARRQKTPNEIALTILLAALTLIFLLVCVTLKSFGIYSAATFPVPVLIALLVCLIPTTIGGLLSAIGISGIDRLIRRNVMATSGGCRRPFTGQDRHHHARQPHGHGVPPCAEHQARAPRRRRAARLARRRDAGGPQHRGAGQAAIQPAWPRSRRAARQVYPLHCTDPHERR
jgi:K+-transporting ATPase ATPase B chain